MIGFFSIFYQIVNIMRLLLFAALVVQTMAASFAVTFNIFLLFIIRQFTPKSFGLYKYILMSFSLFEIMYAIVVILGSPVSPVHMGSSLF